jgi:HEAT repeat protein
MTFEDAYWGDWPDGPDVVQRLVSEMLGSSDSYTRGKFLELLGEMGDPTVVPVLISQLSHAEANVRFWAVSALEQLGDLEGVKFAEEHRKMYPEDFA